MAEIIEDISFAAKILQDDVLAIPTETVYGLAANAYRPDLIARIFEIKQRPFFDPLIVHTDAKQRIYEFADLPPGPLNDLAEAFWPGPLTLILPKKKSIPDIVTSGLPTVAVRIPAHHITLSLLEMLNFPLAAPSANPFGYISPTTTRHVNQQLGSRINYILEGGACRVGLESTIIGLEDNLPVIYRLGGISKEEIEGLIGKIKISTIQHSDPLAPGMLSSHYAPRKKLIIGDVPTLLEKYHLEDPFILTFKEKLDDYDPDLQCLLSESGSLNEAAVNLFDSMHKADASSSGLIIAELVPEIGLGRAINDRLRRAAN